MGSCVIPRETRRCKNPECRNIFISPIHGVHQKFFCSNVCANKYNKYCNKKTKKRSGKTKKGLLTTPKIYTESSLIELSGPKLEKALTEILRNKSKLITF